MMQFAEKPRPPSSYDDATAVLSKYADMGEAAVSAIANKLVADGWVAPETIDPKHLDASGECQWFFAQIHVSDHDAAPLQALRLNVRMAPDCGKVALHLAKMFDDPEKGTVGLAFRVDNWLRAVNAAPTAGAA